MEKFDGICTGEARALCYNVERLGNCQPARDSRFLCLVDNMGVCLSFGRARSRHFKILVCVRRAYAVAFARNLFLAFR